MAFAAIDSSTIQVGDPITKELWDLIKANFDDHESRINSLSTSGGTVFIFNEAVSFVGYSSAEPDVMYYKARQDFSVNDFRAQLFSKQGITTGTLSFDLQKSADTDDANFTTILTANLSFNFASVVDYDEAVATIDSGVNNILTGEVLRVQVTNCPTNTFGNNWSGKILISVGAQ